MEKERKLIVGIGEILWDLLPDGRKLGGAPANFACHIAQFGLGSAVVSAVGNDRYGREAVEILKRKGVATEIETVGYPTGTVDVRLDGNGIPVYDIKKDVAWDNIPYTESLDRTADIATAVCFGTLAQRNGVSENTINRFLDRIPDDEGIYKIFDINLRQHFYTDDIIRKSLQRCNILKINDEELEILIRAAGCTKSGDIENECRSVIASYGLKMLILTCGAKGSYVFTDTDTSFAGTPEVKVADTVGAGDSFTAAFIAGLVSGMHFRDAHTLATETAAFVCSQKGATPELPEELTGKLLSRTFCTASE